MAEFIRIGSRAFNPDHIVDVAFVDEVEKPFVRVFFDVAGEEGNQIQHTYYGEDYRRFLKWWEEKAQVYRPVVTER